MDDARALLRDVRVGDDGGGVVFDDCCCCH